MSQYRMMLFPSPYHLCWDHPGSTSPDLRNMKGLKKIFFARWVKSDYLLALVARSILTGFSSSPSVFLVCREKSQSFGFLTKVVSSNGILHICGIIRVSLRTQVTFGVVSMNLHMFHHFLGLHWPPPSPPATHSHRWPASWWVKKTKVSWIFIVGKR